MYKQTEQGRAYENHRALDFLYLSYAPDRAIRPLLPTSLKSKYQQIHNFLLRLARVETVLRSSYMDTAHQASHFTVPIKFGIDLPRQSEEEAPGSKVLFRYDPKTRQIVHLLRFKMTTFISTLSRYMLDVAINKNWSVMRRRLGRLRRRQVESETSSESSSDDDAEAAYSESSVESGAHDSDVEPETESPGSMIELRSINSLVTYHHLIMDRILRAMLLLSASPSQQSTLVILMKIFTIILDFGKLLKEVEHGIKEEDDAVAPVLVAKQQWEEKESAFVSLWQLSQSDHADLSR